MEDYNFAHSRPRFYRSGEIGEGVHVVDLYMHDSSNFANVLIIEGQSSSDITTIVDFGTYKSAESIINYIDFHNIKLEKVLLIPSHYHWDHLGGLPRLIEFLEEKNSNYFILATKKIQEFLLEPDYKYMQSAKDLFNGMVDQFKPVKYQNLRDIQYFPHTYSLGTMWDLEVHKTPGHTDDHICPLFINRKSGERICFLGEALGINIRNSFVPIPATSAPDFNSEKYLHSISNLSKMRIDMGIFAHVGGIANKDKIQEVIVNAKSGYDIFRKDIRTLYKAKKGTREIVDTMYDKYKKSLRPQSLNEKVARSLAFTLVYGIMLDEGLSKKKKE
jgi:glyoxylase-like metal-dependent hydrolase (beta-lactamase superfamily II)